VTGINDESTLLSANLLPDTPHRFRVTADNPVTHLRLDVHPDGGIARFRAYGQLTDKGRDQLVAAWRAARPSDGFG
jgi:allantoicase